MKDQSSFSTLCHDESYENLFFLVCPWTPPSFQKKQHNSVVYITEMKLETSTQIRRLSRTVCYSRQISPGRPLHKRHNSNNINPKKKNSCYPNRLNWITETRFNTKSGGYNLEPSSDIIETTHNGFCVHWSGRMRD